MMRIVMFWTAKEERNKEKRICHVYQPQKNLSYFCTVLLIIEFFSIDWLHLHINLHILCTIIDTHNCIPGLCSQYLSFQFLYGELKKINICCVWLHVFYIKILTFLNNWMLFVWYMSCYYFFYLPILR